MSNRMFELIGLLLVLGMFIGCNHDSSNPEEQPPAGVTNEIEAIQQMASSDEFVVNTDMTFNDDDLQPGDYGDFGKIDAAITPLRFGRFIRRVVPTVEVNVLAGDTVAIAHVHKDITGVFKIQGINGNGDTVIVEKPFHDGADRNLVFKRIDRNPRRFWRNWLPVATSLVAGGTIARDSSLINITQLDIFTPNDTVTVTNPLRYLLRYRWQHRQIGTHDEVPQSAWSDVPEVNGGDRFTVRVTLASSSLDTDLVALRFGFSAFHRRRVMLQLVSETLNGDGTFTRVFETSAARPLFMHMHPGFFQVGVDATTRGTVFDDTDPYAVSFWGVPYRVF